MCKSKKFMPYCPHKSCAPPNTMVSVLIVVSSRLPNLNIDLIVSLDLTPGDLNDKDDDEPHNKPLGLSDFYVVFPRLALSESGNNINNRKLYNKQHR